MNKKVLPDKLQQYNAFAKQYRAKYKEKHGVKSVPDTHIKEAFKSLNNRAFEEFEKDYKFPDKLSDEEYGKLKELKKAKKESKVVKTKEKLEKLTKPKAIKKEMNIIEKVEDKFDSQKFAVLKNKLTEIVAMI